jgi:hypothetical protein
MERKMKEKAESLTLKANKLVEENEKMTRRYDSTIKQLTTELDSLRNQNAKLTEQLHNSESSSEDLRLQVDQLNKNISFYKSTISQQTDKHAASQRQLQLARMAQEILTATNGLKALLLTTRRELKDDFFTVKIQKCIEIFKMKMSEEVQRRKFLEQTVQRYKKELSYTASTKNIENNFQGMVTPIPTTVSSIGTSLNVPTEPRLPVRPQITSSAPRASTSPSPLSEISPNKLPRLQLMSVAPSSQLERNKENFESKVLLSTPLKKGDTYGGKDSDKTVGKPKPDLEDRLDLKAIEMETLEISKRIEKLRVGMGSGSANPPSLAEMGLISSHRSFLDSHREDGRPGSNRFFYQDSAAK